MVRGDTINSLSDQPVSFIVEKERAPLQITAFNDSVSRTVFVRSSKSLFYWANVTTGWGYFGGFLIDEISGKKYVYPRKVYIDLSRQDIGYLPYFPMKPDLIKKKNRVSIAPFILTGYHHPGIELSFERLHGAERATQLSFRYLLSRNNDFARNSQGYRVNVEEKFFFRNEDDRRLYYSINFEYLRKDHEAVMSFFIPDADPVDETSFFDRLTMVKKRFFTLTPRIGFEKYLTKRLVLDAFFGVGVRYRETELPDIEPGVVLDRTAWEWVDIVYQSNRPRKGFTMNFDLGLSIGWAF